MKKIGFIGLGHMGNPMASNLIKSNYEVHVFDLAPKAIATAVEHGAIAATSIADMAPNMDAVITMVQTGQQVQDICLGKENLFGSLKKDAIYIDCSSIDILVSRALHAEASKRNLAMVDAPVSGGVAGAEAGTLTIMVGGSDAHFKLAQPILAAMGKKIIHAGGPGNGQAAKICNNLLLGISMVGVCEAFSLADRLGLDEKVFYDISSSASGQCWSMTSYCPVPGIIPNAPSNQNYEPGFMAKMMLKDLRLGEHAAESVDASIPLGALTTELYELFVNNGFGERDFSGIIKMFARKKVAIAK